MAPIEGHRPLNPFIDDVKGHFQVDRGGGLLGPHRHDILQVHHSQWESMRSDKVTMKKKIPKLLTMDHCSR